jgi:hypothetical protein
LRAADGVAALDVRFVLSAPEVRVFVNQGGDEEAALDELRVIVRAAVGTAEPFVVFAVVISAALRSVFRTVLAWVAAVSHPAALALVVDCAIVDETRLDPVVTLIAEVRC